jgi:hypothetical protein
MTFADKLKKFKSERVGFKVETEEIAKGLAEVFQMEGLLSSIGLSPVELMNVAWEEYSNDDLWVAANYPGDTVELSYGTCKKSGKYLDSILSVTSQELQRYLKIRKGIQENPEVYFPTPTKEIYDELMNTLDSLGCLWMCGEKPMEYNGFTSDHKICVRYSTDIMIDGYDAGKDNIISLTSEPPTPSQTITIVSDGYHKVTAESNGITAEATCCPTDTFSITKGTHMALQRLLEKQKKAEEKPKFNRGDIVEVIVGGLDGTPSATTGLQGKVMQTSIFPEVLFPITIGARNFWAFRQDVLKLIRRKPCK